MRALLRLLGTIVLVVAVVVLVIFAVQNTHSVTATFAGQSFTAGLWWLVIGAAILGFLLAAILLAPGWVSAGWRGRTLRRASERREQELATVRRQQEQMQAEHERLVTEHRQTVAERDRLRASAAQPAAAGVPAAPTQRTPAPTTTVYSADEAAGRGQSTMGGPSPQSVRRQEEWDPNGPAVPTA